MKYSLPISLPEDREISSLFNLLVSKLIACADQIVNSSVKYLPIAEKFAIDTLDAMFAPKQILRQILLILAVRVVLFGQSLSSRIGYKLYCLLSKQGREEQQLLDKLANVKTYTDWRDIAAQLDVMRGIDKWRHVENSTFYDSKVMKRRIKDTLEMVERGDVFDLMFRMRGGLAREQFGIQHEGLYSRAMAGTKDIVEQYNNTVVKALNFICDSPLGDEEVRQCVFCIYYIYI